LVSHEQTGSRRKRKRIEGEVRQEAGKATGDKSEQIRGKREKIEGRIEQGIGKVKRKVTKK
jgi:uncharacterized protein YjbJ (UPF0337 family)